MVETAQAHGVGKHRIVIESIGQAGAHVISVLARVSGLPKPRLASLLYRAPAELVNGLDQQIAEAVTGELSKLGLQCRALAPDEQFDAGTPKFELAILPRDPGKMSALASRVAFLLGVKPEQAVALISQSPTLLIGQVSHATVEAFRPQLEALDVELMVSNIAEASYDLLLTSNRPGDRERVCRYLSSIKGVREVESGQSPVLAQRLTTHEAEAYWAAMARSGLPVRLINRTFERVDIVLEYAPPTPAVHTYLMQNTGMPGNIAQAITRRFRPAGRSQPVVIFQQLDLETADSRLRDLSALRCRCDLKRYSLQRYRIRIESHTGAAQADAIISTITGQQPQNGLSSGGTAGIIDSPLTLVQAKWLAWELKKIGLRSSLLQYE